MAEPEYDVAASRLWELTQADWHITLSHCLTEPVCAYIDLVSDDADLPKLIGFIGEYDANKSIKSAIEYHIKNLETFYAEKQKQP